MAANTAPIYTLTPNISACQLTSTATALSASDGTGTIGTSMFTSFIAGTNGSFVSRIRIYAYATSTAVTMAATVIRLYMSTVSTGSTTASTTWLIQEVAVGALVAASSTSALMPLEVVLNMAIPANYAIVASIDSIPVTGTGWQVVTIGGNY